MTDKRLREDVRSYEFSLEEKMKEFIHFHINIIRKI